MALLLKERFAARGVKGLLFDLDDTLLATSVSVRRCKDDFVDWVEEKLGGKKEELMEVFEVVNLESYRTHYVNPMRWQWVVRQMAVKLGHEEERFLAGLPLLMRAYERVPEMIPGARATLKLYRATGVRMGVVTHSNVPWAMRKVTELGLVEEIDGLWIGDENGPKTERDWLEGARMLGLSVEETIGFGDSLTGDLVPMSRLGMRAVGIKPIWRVYKPEEVPAGVTMVDYFRQTPEVVLEMLS